jgi:prepilin-type N-terminal cleavage/methylation domain-containing protein
MVRVAERGVTLFEMLVVVSLIAVMIAISFPAITSGLDSLRLRSSASDLIGAFNLALTRADRLQEAVDVTISAAGHFVEARTMASRIVRRTELPKEIRIAHVFPEEALLTPSENRALPDRHFLIYPNGAVPRITIDLVNEHGAHRFVLLDPITGVARERVADDPQAEYADAAARQAKKDQP